MKFLFKIFAIGARQLVVQDAAEIILSFFFIKFSLTPNTIVLSAFLHGAETIIFFAPLLKCGNNFSLLLNLPVHSKTISTPEFFQLIFFNSVS